MPIASIIGGLISGSGSASAGAGAYDESKTLADQDRKALAPWTNAGTGAINRLSDLFMLGDTPENWQRNQDQALSTFTKSPGYTFRLQQGVNALDRSAASRGMVLSGAQKQAVGDYGQNQASQEWGNWVNQLMGISGQGEQGAVAANSAANQAMIPGIGMNYQGNVGASNALANGISQGFGNLLTLGAYGGSGGKLGLPGIGTDGARPRGWV